MIRMVKMAKPPEMDTDVDGTALLGGDLVERACRVDESDKKERDSQLRLQQAEFYCKERCQCDENANGNIPKAHGLPLKGEWLVCASSEASDWNGDTNV